MVTREEVSAYLDNAEWRPCTFTAFNHASDNGWVLDMKNSTGKTVDVDDSEFVRVPLDEETRASLKLGSKSTLSTIKAICDEYNRANYPRLAMYYINDIYLLFAIRLA